MAADDAAGSTVTLCLFDDIADPGARGFEVKGPDGDLDVIVVRLGSEVRGYLNRCPHQGTPLETFPDRFLTRDGSLLVCSTHGARFRLEDGLCVEGPCEGKCLAPVVVERAGMKVVLHRGNTKV